MWRGVNNIWSHYTAWHAEGGCPAHRSVDPVCWGVSGVFDSQLDDALPLQQAWAGAHGETSHLLHTRDEEIHPAKVKHRQRADLYINDGT